MYKVAVIRQKPLTNAEKKAAIARKAASARTVKSARFSRGYSTHVDKS